ncbi:hypothetical protein FBEOM_4615 [Fusarium beomiforme]|uniref:Heterokaryon incompatibility domain-containing protein n=1 Tax=Fusarium beomiforme TaxID=44412 RepID=A0A9P5AMR5_9HYPO|nr:hypothetical protein FBEOM_4615 [Fusarium beomiforme]
MSGLEIPSFIIGLSGLIAVFEKGFEVWRVIRKADDFGDDVADWMCKLEMEFFRFQTWWTALEHLAITNKSSHSILNVPLQSSPLQVTLDKQFGKPIIDAATSVLRLLEKIEGILQSNGVLVIMKAEPFATDDGVDLGEQTTKARQRLKRFANELLKHTSWTTRIKHSTSPWKDDSDKTALDDSLESIIYWNNTLYSILPQNIRDSILELGIAGYALDSSDNIKDVVNLSDDRNGTLSQSARLMTIRQRFKDGPDSSKDMAAIIHQMELKENAFEGLVAANVFKGCQYTIAQHTSAGGEITRVLVEWIPIPKDFDTYKLAHSRMAQISYTLQQIGESSAIQPLPVLGFVEFGGARSFGLVSTLPRNVTSSTRVYTLHDMLSGGAEIGGGKQVRSASAACSSQFESASAAGVEADEARSNSAPLDLSIPIIGGFAISRPDSPTELSISASVEDTEIVYLHPDIRKRLKGGSKQTGSEQRFQRIHDIYAVGLLLVEIGYWRSIARIAESGSKGSNSDSMSPEQFKEAVVKKCRSDLAFWAGETYRDIALRCLLAGEPGGVQAEDDAAGLNNFFTGKRDKKVLFTCSLETSCRFGSLVRDDLEGRMADWGGTLPEDQLFHIAAQRGPFSREQLGDSMRTQSPIPEDFNMLSIYYGPDDDLEILQVVVAASKGTNPAGGLLQGVPLDHLPLTIQDAITVTRGLNLQYLWVDALCIIQDSNDDKEKELKNMHSFYENSYVTISVTARDSSEGFLDTQFGNVGSVPYVLPDGQLGSLWIEVHPFFDPDLSKIERRAWTLQERLLSPRILYYSNDPSILAWDCASLLDAYGGDKPCRGTKPLHWQLGRLHDRVTISEHLDDSDHELTAEIHAEWRGLTSQFTRRELSFELDTFHALASLAAKFHAALPKDHVYAAGLWLDPSQGYKNFVYSLGWFSLHDELYQTSEYVAPSWSWASVRGPLFVNSPYGVPPEPMCSILRYCPKLKSSKLPYGQLLEGTFLEIQGILRQVRCGFTNSQQDDYEEEEKESGEEDEDEEGQYPRLNHGSFDTKQLASQHQTNGLLWYLLLSGNQGLFLDSVQGPGGAKNVFRRIGVTSEVIGSTSCLYRLNAIKYMTYIMASINGPPSVDFTNFSHTNLPSPSSIRLLSFVKRPRQVSPPSIFGEPLLECFLETVDINKTPEFDLISSTWGNPDSADPGGIDEYGPMHRYPIAIDGKIMFLPKNIYEALKMARKINDPVEQRSEPFSETELMSAVDMNHLPKVQSLLEQGAHIHAQDCYGKTAIHHAAQNRHFDIINILLDYGASMKIIDSYGRTPMDYFTYTEPKEWEKIEEIAYKMQQSPEERELAPVPEVVRVGRPMWIDAVCMDQGNADERASHASLMTQIYGRAHSVIAWVGIQDDDTKLAPEAILSTLLLESKDMDEVMSDEICPAASVGYPKMPSDEEKSSIVRFLRRSWFERPDLIHEVAFGRAITVYCGADSLPLSHIMQFLRTEAYSGTYLPSDLEIWSLLGSRISKKRRSLDSVGGQKKMRRNEI